MTEHFPMLLAQQVPASGRPEVRAPFDGKVLGSVDLGGATAVEAALDVAYQLFRDRDRWLSPAERITVLRKAARLMEARAEQLA